MEVIPSIDLRGGRCVRLYQGDYDKETVYSDDPLAVACQWQEMGASRIHIVDLDGAASGTQANLEILRQLGNSIDVPLQVGGGIRDMGSVENILDMGVKRIVLGTSAVENPSLVEQACSRFGAEAIVVGVDARDGMVAIRGWRESSSIAVLDLMHRMTALGVGRFIYTDISRDGTLSEPNFQSLEELIEKCDAALVASGGISSIDHLKRLASLGVEGAIMGTALYTRDIDLREAIAEV
ncbi:MAG: 1-(5-phosphoribosyl)-5-[(5-phosphoribosylamino)methylideneamino]imidazole-4-carboxamide isomerase [Dehalococcoidia bacterium]|jgi:phosphoribosylformimino-5-aminoimidazole carboxamide ribotide isomerase|nr:1-(5-phosphoribosyl)-5-[(5-phosphoribosylamino)methylideneamino]imidazole-4-carboxamide isomerase [Dehalococcoidia bacterium]